jgi:hypothetical protein
VRVKISQRKLVLHTPNFQASMLTSLRGLITVVPEIKNAGVRSSIYMPGSNNIALDSES